MTQPASYQVPAHPSGLEMRTQLNTIVLAILGDNAGPTPPPETYPGMMWGDTTAQRLKRRTNANDGWVDIGPLDNFLGDISNQINNATANKVSKTGDTMTGALTMANTQSIFFRSSGGYQSSLRADDVWQTGFINQAANAWNMQISDDGILFARTKLITPWVDVNTGYKCAGQMAIGGQGGYMMWNEGNSEGLSGQTSFVNNQGGGSGGFSWRNVNSDNTAQTFKMYIDGGGTLHVPGNLYVGYTIYGGNGSSQLATDGNVYGGQWGGWLRDWLNANKSNRGGCGTNNVQVEIGPIAPQNTGPLDAGSPWVLCGVRVGGWVGPSGDCVNSIYTRLTQVQTP